MYIYTSSHFLAKNGSFLKIAQTLNRSKISPKLPTNLCRYLQVPTPSSFFSFWRPLGTRNQLRSAPRQQPAAVDLLGAGILAVSQLRPSLVVFGGCGFSGRGCSGFWRAWAAVLRVLHFLAGQAVLGGSSVSGRDRFRPFWRGQIWWKLFLRAWCRL